MIHRRFSRHAASAACTALAAAVGIALAGNGPATAAPDTNWDGPYVGATVGANLSSARVSLPGDVGDVLLSDHDQSTAFSGGGLIGFNHQFDYYVVGLEADVVDGADTLHATACTAPDGCWTPAHDSFTTHNQLREGVTGHLRVRLGYADGRTLFYVAGGYSVADTRMSLVGDCYDPTNPAVPTIYNFSRGKTVSGFNVGAGVERALTDHVAVRVEYLYDDFGSQLYRGAAPEWNDRRISLDNSIFRVAASYRF